MTPVQQLAKEYLDHGWKLCRINPGSKGPMYPSWNHPGHDITEPDAFTLGWGVGLLHAFSGTCALDIDHYGEAEKFLAGYGVDLEALLLADDAVQIVSGRPDSAKLLYQLPVPRVGVACAKFNTGLFDDKGKPIFKMALDLRCMASSDNSQQDVLPPTMHPKMGRPYEWQFGDFASWASLPDLPECIIAVWDELRPNVPASVSTVVAAKSTAGSLDAPEGLEAIAKWLETQDPSMVRDEWLKVGAKIHHATAGSQEGYVLFDKWSQRSSKYENNADTYTRWKSWRVDHPKPTTIDADLRSMPADPSEFAIVEKPVPGTPGPADLVEIETAFDRENRELLQKFVVLQTGGVKPFFLQPGHPIPSIAQAAGFAGCEKTDRQINDIFGPYLSPIPRGKTIEMPDAGPLLKRASWRTQVHRVGFSPGRPLHYVESDGHKYLNAFKQVVVEPVQPRPHQIEPLNWLLRRVMDDYNKPTGGEFSKWLVQLYSFVLQNPGVKVKWAPLLYSKTQGTGKTTLMQTLPGLLFGQHYVKPMMHSVLKERFAGARFESTWWVCLAEMHSDAGKVDAKAIANKLKPWITDDMIQIEKKGVDQQEIKNHLQLTAMSQHEDALFIEEGQDDRRWLVGQMLEQQLTVDEMKMLNPLFGDPHVRDPRAEAWLHWYFLNEDVTGMNPSQPPPMTAAKSRVTINSRSVWEDLVFEALEDQRPPFDKDFTMPTALTQGLLVGKNVTIAQAKMLLGKAGGVELPRNAHYRNLYRMRYHAQWSHCSHDQIYVHMKSGARPFEVDDISDLL